MPPEKDGLLVSEKIWPLTPFPRASVTPLTPVAMVKFEFVEVFVTMPGPDEALPKVSVTFNVTLAGANVPVTTPAPDVMLQVEPTVPTVKPAVTVVPPPPRVQVKGALPPVMAMPVSE